MDLRQAKELLCTGRHALVSVAHLSLLRSATDCSLELPGTALFALTLVSEATTVQSWGQGRDVEAGDQAAKSDHVDEGEQCKRHLDIKGGWFEHLRR